MVNRRAYKRVKVNSVDRVRLLEVLDTQEVGVLGLDIAKNEIVACLRWGKGEFERPWSVLNPCEIKELVELCEWLIKKGLDLEVALESTGTYGDVVRFAMTNAKLKVFRVSGKSVYDYKEVFDGVPSQHDGKDAAVIAELCAMGKKAAWPFELASDVMAEISCLVQRMDAFQSEFVVWQGRLESQLARHWPELGGLSQARNITTLRMLHEYGSPVAVAESQAVIQKLISWGRGKLSEAHAQSILRSAETTKGIPMNRYEAQWLQEICGRCLQQKRGIQHCEKQLKRLLNRDPFWTRYVPAMGAGTLGVMLSTIGDPRAYTSAGAILKACGLNLKELSSGKRIGEKAITKRGPSMLRRWVYFWAMRSIQRDELREWYHRFGSPGYGHRDRPMKHRKMKGLICMMRKLVRSLWSSMKHDEAFDYNRIVQQLPKPKRRRRSKAKSTRPSSIRE